MTAESIGASKGGGYARYLESKTVVPEPGAYYLTPEGEPTQAPGRWLASPDSLARLGIEGQRVDGQDFVALMEGRHPRTGRWLRAAGGNGERGGGIDITFSAPKSVSVAWALGDEQTRAVLEAAHTEAVARAVGFVRDEVPTVRRRQGRLVYEETARDLLAAEYRHTTARGVVPGEMPDPQLHSHVVITSAVREDGGLVAVASRPVFRAAREAGAFYRSALAEELAARGFEIRSGMGRGGRYFEVAGYDRGLLEAFSARSREVAQAAERFRAKYGRAPERGELRALKRENRRAKTLVHKGDLDRAWQETARGQPEHVGVPVEGSMEGRGVGLAERVEERLTERAATFTPGELRAVVLEQSVGELAPEDAITFARTMVSDRRVLPLEGGRFTTLTVRAQEQAIQRRISSLAQEVGRDVGAVAREVAAGEVAERIGSALSPEQQQALEAITGASRSGLLIGPAGTGKGVVIDAAARAEQLAGRDTIGIAVSGSTAQRLGRDSPALAGQTMTLDSLVAKAQHGRLLLGEETTVYLDEAGMCDTKRLDKLTAVVEHGGAKLVLIGDGAQLPSIGAGGMFDHLTQSVPYAELSDVRRTLDPAEQQAWADLRAGRAEKAMAHYHARGQLHMADTRDQAVERAAQAWALLTQEHRVQEVALISDASNQEINRLNARAQHLRRERGELGDLEVHIPGTHYGISSKDRITLTSQHYTPGQTRIENGSQGEVLNITDTGQVTVRFDLTGRTRVLQDEDLGKVRLAYAQHIHRAQGATVQHTLVVTGAWQTSKEPAYVEASRSRGRTHWYVNRDDLGTDGQDPDRINRLAQAMNTSHAQTPSLQHAERDLLDQPEEWLRVDRLPTPNRVLVPWAINLARDLAHPTPAPEHER
jgi:conjugative relaxase-like TrwC/TraI family protein